MDFLDPAKKRAHNIRLLIGYCLMAILITLLTVIMIFGAYGYDIDRSTGEVIQNSLVFADTEPESAEVYINGKLQKNRTDTRFSLPAGKYEIEMSRSGYRSWKHTLDLEGGTIERLNYARLYPTKTEATELLHLTEFPALTTQTFDRNRLLIQFPAQLNTFFDYDLSAAIGGNNPQARTVVLPDGLLSESNLAHKLTSIEWAADNRHLLLRHDFGDNFEFLVIDRETPAASININKTLSLVPGQVRLLDKRSDQIHMLVNGSLQSADLKTRATTPIAANVAAFKGFGSDSLIYSQQTSKTESVHVLIRQGGKTYELRELAADKTALVDVSRYGNRTYYAIGVVDEGKTYIYRDPVANFFSNNLKLKPTPFVLLQVDKVATMEFSPSSRFFSVRGGQKLGIYDLETKRKFHYELDASLNLEQPVKWMDDYRLMYVVNKVVYSIDFDGGNNQSLIAVSPSFIVYFDRDYRWLYSFDISKTKANQPVLYRTSLRATP